LPFGDAISRFNPVWGQGMTVAAQEAVLLRQLLCASGGDARALADLAPAFFTEACSVIESPWGQAAVPDFVMPETEGDRPPDFENQLRVSKSRQLPRCARARSGGMAGRDAQGSSTSRQLPGTSLSGAFPVPQCRLGRFATGLQWC
jgi:hypothetical protein